MIDTPTRVQPDGAVASAPGAVPTPRAASPRRRANRRRLGLAGVRLAVVVALLAAWQLCVNAKIVDPFFWGEPRGVWADLQDWVTVGTSQGSLGDQILVTLEEAVLGFVIGSILGIVFGIALGRIHLLSEIFAPFLKAANSIPRIILGSIFTVAFGFGIQSKVVLAVVLVFFGVFFNAFQGAREVDRNLIANARLLGASRWRVTRDVVLPSAFTWILASLHISFGFALIGALVGEILGANQGLGLLIRSSQNNFDMNGVLAGMVLVAVIALTAESLITLLERRLLRWRPPQTHGGAAIE
ncbi:ABC transporter permease [Intrasporangium oryzae NRRL B-24470]|uniref:ABC transporter permease n=1 Tax=Intrasporangium oryzae NRRL B-24470 TaxID=1386089 RepID=W9G1J2_9MICO|nr:ABC transporter permease [Intrasporangium oryzae]EWS99960.1 ABC transporter permease [Intrasporangium oryzae NRRL B-24470]